MTHRTCSVLLLLALAACAAPQANQVALPAAPPPGEPGNLAGMDAARVKTAFGAPQFVRKDGTAEIWRYDAANCKAFFFLYPNGTSMAVRHVETTPHAASEAADSACLQALMARAKTA
jgi:hypothetical protein